MTTLCIVDMQAKFTASKQCLDEVCHQVRLAKRRKAGIVILEFRGEGPTLSPIKNLLRSYKRKIYKKKAFDAGGDVLLKAAKVMNFPTNKVRFVGVNRSYCVYDTACEYQEESGGRIEVAIEATWCRNPTQGLNKLRDIGRLV